MSVRLVVASLAIGMFCIAPQRATAAQEEFTCPVTKPDPAFVPPAPFAKGNSWFGTERLWTILDSPWVANRHVDLGYEVRKRVWFSRDYDVKRDGQPTLTVAGRRLDGPSGPVNLDVNGGYVDRPGQLRQNFMPSHLYFPTLGCWEITAHYKGTDLTLVVKVVGP